jgi:nucleotide-binding universal stress UspA family protein
MREPRVIERVARRARCPVLVVPHGTERPPDHIGVAIDAGPASGPVLGAAWGVAQSLGARLTILHVFPEDDEPVVPPDTSRSFGLGDEPYAALKAWIATLILPRGSTGGLEVSSGDPARELMRMAKQFALDLLVVGKQGADGAPPGSLGSVARDLLSRSEWPVLAVEA